MTTKLRASAIAALLITAVAACSGKPSTPTLEGDLQGDLDAAKSSAIQLAPSGRGTEVVSAEELGKAPGAGRERATQQVPRLTVRKATVGHAPTIAPAPTTGSPVVLAPKPDAPVVDADTLAPIERRPTPARPSATPEPRGGYKSVGDVIRDAPFPINP